MKQTVDGGFTWIELGFTHCLADEDGKVIAHVVAEPPNAPARPVQAFYKNQFQGLYIGVEQAKQAMQDLIRIDAGRGYSRS